MSDTRRIAIVTLRLDEDSYRYLLDHMVRSLDYGGEWTAQTHPLLIQMRQNVEYTTLARLPEKKAAE